jgi:hypothetical protein
MSFIKRIWRIKDWIHFTGSCENEKCWTSFCSSSPNIFECRSAMITALVYMKVSPPTCIPAPPKGTQSQCRAVNFPALIRHQRWKNVHTLSDMFLGITQCCEWNLSATRVHFLQALRVMTQQNTVNLSWADNNPFNFEFYEHIEVISTTTCKMLGLCKVSVDMSENSTRAE